MKAVGVELEDRVEELLGVPVPEAVTVELEVVLQSVDEEVRDGVTDGVSDDVGVYDAEGDGRQGR